ncbi:DNA polymerase III subunit gamma/tau C-terminal domain-containing protein, partial [Pseudomonadota bacterium]
GGSVGEIPVRAMLGMIDESYVFELLENLQVGDADKVLGTVDNMAQRAVDYAAALDDLLLQMHNLALMQIAPKAALAKLIDSERITALSQRYRPEQIQLYYQIALIGKRDLPLAPDARSGFEMVLLRMLAFNPETDAAMKPSSEKTIQQTSLQGARITSSTESRAAAPQDPVPTATKARPGYPVGESQVKETETGTDTQIKEDRDQASYQTTAKGDIEISPLAEQWHTVINQSNLRGLVKELAMNVSPVSLSDGNWSLRLEESHRHFLNKERQEMLLNSLSNSSEEKVGLKIELGELEHATPAQIDASIAAQRQQQLVESMENDPNVQELIDRFDATVIADSIRPRD